VHVNTRWQLFVFVYVLYRERLRILLAKVRGFLVFAVATTGRNRVLLVKVRGFLVFALGEYSKSFLRKLEGFLGFHLSLVL
jgi:hypothetical protein